MVRLVKWLSHEFVVLVSRVQFPYLTQSQKTSTSARFLFYIKEEINFMLTIDYILNIC